MSVQASAPGVMMQAQPRRLLSMMQQYVLGSVVLFGLLIAAVVGMVGAAATSSEVPIRIEPLMNARLGADGDSLNVADGTAQARLQVQLPAAQTDREGHSQRWVLWMPRSPVEDVWLQYGDWQSRRESFFAPSSQDALLASGFFFALPDSLSGDVEIRLHARSAGQSVLAPRIIREDQRWVVIARSVALSVFAYATLFVIALVALQLYTASGQKVFAALFAACVLCFLELAVHNGQAYGMPIVRFLGYWGEAGIWGVEMLFCAAMLQLVHRYATERKSVPWIRLLANGMTGVLLVSAMFCLVADVLLPPLATEAAKTLLWILSATLMIAIAFDALRRKVPLIRTILAIGGMTFIAVLARELMSRGWIGTTPLAQYGYQLMLVVLLVAITAALIMGIAEFRKENVHLQRVHQDVTQRLHRETAIAALSGSLRTQLRKASPTELETTVMRGLMEHLQPLVNADTLTLVAEGYHGRNLLLCEPREQQSQLWVQMRARTDELRAESGSLRPQQRSLRDASGAPLVEALIPMRLRAPSWGALVMQRKGDTGFSHQELMLAEQMLQVAVQQSSDALATMQLRRSAEMDALTGTFNRRTIDLWLGQAFRQAYNDNGQVAVLFVDIDHFKSINDRYGHACGDQALRDVARMLHARVGQEGLLGRYGGEEFIVVMPGRDAAQARQLAESIREAIQAYTVKCGEHVINMTVSIGVATRLPQESMPEAAVARADKALYAAKNGGRNQVQLAPAIFR